MNLKQIIDLLAACPVAAEIVVEVLADDGEANLMRIEKVRVETDMEGRVTVTLVL